MDNQKKDLPTSPIGWPKEHTAYHPDNGARQQAAIRLAVSLLLLLWTSATFPDPNQTGISIHMLATAGGFFLFALSLLAATIIDPRPAVGRRIYG